MNKARIPPPSGVGSVKTELDLSKGGILTISGGTVDVAQGGTITFGSSADSLQLTGGSLVADASTMLTDNFSAVTGAASALKGESGNLNLRLDQDTYTAEQYAAAKNALLSGDSDNAVLSFLNATLELDSTTGEELVIGGSESGSTVTISNTTPVVVTGTSIDESATPIESVPSKIVSVVSSTDTEKLLSADTIEISGSTFVVQGLQVAASTADDGTVTIAAESNSNITLTGGEEGFTGVINAEGQSVATNITVSGESTVTIGLAGDTSEQNLTTQNVTVAKGTFAVEGNGLETTQISIASLEIGAAEGDDATSTSSSESYATVSNASLVSEKTTIADGQMNFLDAVADLGTVTATGGVLFLDPSYVKVTLDGALGAVVYDGSGSVLAINYNGDDLQALAQYAGFTTTAKGDKFTVAADESLLALGQSVTLDDGKIVVDANVDEEGKIDGETVSADVYFGDNSLLIIDGSAINGATAADAAITATGKTLHVANTSKLLIVDAVEGETYTIISGASDTSTSFEGGAYDSETGTTGWSGSNLLTTTDMLTLVAVENTAGTIDGTVFSVEKEDAQKVFPDLSEGMAAAVNDLYAASGETGERTDLADPYSKHQGIKFLTRATDKRFLGADHKAAASTIESAARIAFAGAVPQMTKMASDSATNAVVNRLGIANPGSGVKAMDAEGRLVDDKVHGFALWIAPLWQNQSGFGMEAGNLDYGYNANLGGVSLGADYTFDNSIRAGIMFNKTFLIWGTT